MITQQQKQLTTELITFISHAPTAFHAVEECAKALDAEGFCALQEGDKWTLDAGKSYYVTRNGSSIIAFKLPKAAPQSFMIAASHTDSPMFKLKNNCLSPACGAYVRLNTEVYGGTILSSWLDRPLSLAGRVIVKNGDVFEIKTVKLDRDLLLIPNVAIHLNRSVNAGYTFNPAVDMLPLFAIGEVGSISPRALVAKELGIPEESIVGSDLYVINRMPGTLWGAEEEFFSAPRIDNLMCLFGTLKGFLAAEETNTIKILFSADNEETGSATKQGAGSVFLSDTLDRICASVGADKCRLLAASMMVSADNGHAKHPNHPELSDAQNAPMLGAGVVIKSNAAQKYTTDGLSLSLFEEICRRADVPVQHYANRSDQPGGSTLGSISNTLVPLITVDIGMAQLAMHSSYETAGSADTEALVKAMTAFYSATLKPLSQHSLKL